MANQSIIIVALSFFNHEEDVAYEPTRFKQFDKAFVEWTYGGAGVRFKGDKAVYGLAGKWSIATNFQWEEDIARFCKQAKALGISHIEGEYFDYELGLDFATRGVFEINTSNSEVTYHDTTELYDSLLDFAKAYGYVPQDFVLDDEADDFDEQIDTLTDAIDIGTAKTLGVEL